MKKKKIRILSMFLALVLLFGILGGMAAPASAASTTRPPNEFIWERIAELERIYVGTYFNVGQNTACGRKTSGHGCSRCNTTNIVNTAWFRDLYSVQIKTSQFGSSGSSCVGFAWYAAWHIFRTTDRDSVTRTVVGKYNSRSSAKTAIQNKALLGDYLYLTGKVGNHAVIYLGCNSTGVEVIDCNGSGKYNCLVQRRTIPWGSINTASICRFRSVSGNYCYHEKGYKTVRQGGEYTAVCKSCGMEYLLGQVNTQDEGIYIVKSNNASFCTNPYQDSGFVCPRKGNYLNVLGSIMNAYGNTFLLLKGGGYIWSGYVKKVS